MGGFFGAVADHDTVYDVFFGVDYHSHLGTHRAGMAAWNKDMGFQRSIHSIENASFRTKFENDAEYMHGTCCIGCIADVEPQPILIRSKLGVYAISVIGRVNNLAELADEYIKNANGHFEALSAGKVNMVELIAMMINQKDNFAEGIRYAQSRISGTANILVMTDEGKLIAARDRLGRLPVVIGKGEDGYCITFESLAYEKIGYTFYKLLGPGECVEVTKDTVKVLTPAGTEEKFCAFLWTYFGYASSRYEGLNVESVRNRGGANLAKADAERGMPESIDYVCGVPDSGVPYAVGYANECHIPFARALIKYTPTWSRSFMPGAAEKRHHVAKMKLLPVNDYINGKKLILVDDSIVRGTQMQETVDFLYQNGAKELHMRSCCPPIMYACKYLNFSRSNSELDMISRRTIKELEGLEGEKHLSEYADGTTERGKKLRCEICKKLNLSSLEFQTMDALIEAIGLPREKICTYCWTGEE